MNRWSKTWKFYSNMVSSLVRTDMCIYLELWSVEAQNWEDLRPCTQGKHWRSGESGHRPKAWIETERTSECTNIEGQLGSSICFLFFFLKMNSLRVILIVAYRRIVVWRTESYFRTVWGSISVLKFYVA